MTKQIQFFDTTLRDGEQTIGRRGQGRRCWTQEASESPG